MERFSEALRDHLREPIPVSRNLTCYTDQWCILHFSKDVTRNIHVFVERMFRKVLQFYLLYSIYTASCGWRCEAA